MDSTWQILQEHLPQALIDTAYMVVISGVVGVVLGSLVGLLLYLTENRLFHPNHVLNSVVGFIVNAIRSLPFLILLVVLIPVVQALLGKGAALGTVLAFMMSVIGLSLPEMIILKKVLTVKLASSP